MRSATIQKLAISLAIVGLYASVPVLAGAPGIAPNILQATVAGAPLSVWAVVFLLLGFPVLAWACARMISAGDSAADATSPSQKDES